MAALLSAGLAFGQGFNQLATNADGSVLYFSSPLRLKGTTQYLYPKVFVWDAARGVRLFEQRDAAEDVPFMLVAPDVSSDGATVVVTGSRSCYDSHCYNNVEEYQSTFYTQGKPAADVPGSAILSRNGRYALLRSSVPWWNTSSTMTLMDLQTGQRTTFPNLDEPPAGKHEVADNGTFVVAGPNGFTITRAGQAKTVSVTLSPLTFSVLPPAVSYPNNPLINAAGTLVIYQSLESKLGTATLSAWSAASGASTTLATGADNVPDFRPSISDDGSLVAFLYGANRQVYVTGSDGKGLRPLTSFAEPATEVELSGDGTVAFVVTAANRIARVNVATGQSVDIVPPTPYTNSTPTANVSLADPPHPSPVFPYPVDRAKAVTIPGSALPLSLSAVQLWSAGKQVPAAGVSATSATYIAYWDMPYDPQEMEVWVAGNTSPFVPGFQVQASPPSTGVVAVHQDFLSVVSAANPALPGEYLHVYAANLGPVTPVPPVGLPAPAQPLARLAAPISCMVGVPVTPSFVGLAPGLWNIFQLDVRMPDSFAGLPTPLEFFCQVGDPSLGNRYRIFAPLYVQ